MIKTKPNPEPAKAEVRQPKPRLPKAPKKPAVAPVGDDVPMPKQKDDYNAYMREYQRRRRLKKAQDAGL